MIGPNVSKAAGWKMMFAGKVEYIIIIIIIIKILFLLKVQLRYKVHNNIVSATNDLKEKSLIE